jgi:hypothetical protein
MFLTHVYLEIISFLLYDDWLQLHWLLIAYGLFGKAAKYSRSAFR